MTRRRSGRALVPALLVGIAAILLASGGCGRRTASPPVPPDVPHTLPSEEEAQRIREGAPEAIPVPAGEGAAARPDSAPAAPVPDEAGTRPGYRVQVFATADPALAEKRAGEMRELFEEEVYVEFDGELFKVRVGDCTSRDEAANLRRRALGFGLEGAFVVDARVRER